MYKIITDKDEILEWQTRFEKIIKYNTKKYTDKNITYKNKREEDREKKYEVFWSSDFYFWSTSFPYENDNKEIIRYKNWFGTTEPTNNNNLPLVFEISISSCYNGGNVKTAGRFVKDNKKIFVAHNGNIKKGKEIFWEHFENFKKIDVENEPHIIICELSNNDDKINQEKIKNFIEEMRMIKDPSKGKSVNSPPAPNTIIPRPKVKTQKLTGNPNSNNEILQLVSNIRRLINKINKYRRKNRKHPIFIDKNLSQLWTDIEEPCTSEDEKGFVFFTLKLYILIYEYTRIENKKGEKHFYNFFLPDKFLEKGTKTREFINIVGSLRHSYAHRDPEYKVPIKTMSYPDILEKLLGDSNKNEDYSIMQIELLKRFEKSMKTLLEIVKNESKITPQNP